MGLRSIKGEISNFPSKMVILGFLALFLGSGSVATAQIAQTAQKQINEITVLKRSLTPAEQKMSFNLVLLSRAAQNRLPADLKHLLNPATLDSNGDALVIVDGIMTPTLLTSAVMHRVDKVDGKLPISAFTTGKVRAHVPVQSLLTLAGQADVKSLRDPEHYTTNAGSLTSQGYIAHGVKQVVAGGVTGAGINVGVLSDSASATRVAALIASGDLPANTVVLPGQAGSGADEGTAMMEIVHDLAPGANLFFATADPTQAQFAANIRTLRYVYHCDVIVDDITYFAEGAFQDGTVADAVNDVTADGALYVSSAANSGNLTSGTSGTWEGDYLAGPAGTILPADDGSVHNFGTVSNASYTDVLTGSSTFISLKWSDPLGAANDDYDLYILNAAGTSVLAASAGSQTGTQDPAEYVSGMFPVGAQVLVLQYAGQRRALRIDTNRGRLAIGTAGSTFGHNAAATTFTMAAVYWNSAHQGARPFVGGSPNPIETFSSDGPRKIFFQPDGTALTPGNYLFSTGGGVTLQKPDATAADGVTTRTPGFNPFFGTSAAAPHAAGIAALVKSANPGLSNTQIRDILDGTALDNMAPGVDRDSGYGILWAPAAIAAAQAALSTF